MKDFSVVLEESRTRRKIVCNIDAHDFASAASTAYLKRFRMAEKTGHDWRIISLKENRKFT